MPVYEYVCTDCHTKFDSLRAMSRADEAIACEQCGGTHTSRVLSVFAVKSFAIKGLAVKGSSDGASVIEASGGGGCACGGACSCGGH